MQQSYSLSRSLFAEQLTPLPSVIMSFTNKNATTDISKPRITCGTQSGRREGSFGVLGPSYLWQFCFK
jgi:hypothetical protein